jgi:phosphate starvation-inducible PhoH-like protein
MVTRSKKFHDHPDQSYQKTQRVQKQIKTQESESSIDLEKPQTEKHTSQNMGNSLKIKLDHLKTFEPLTENQKIFFDAYDKGSYAFMLYGSAGTGKSFIALYKALEEVLDKGNPFKKLVIIRSSVPSRDSGFLPGSLEEKNAIYEEPYKQICADLFGRSDAYDRLKEQGYIEFLSTSYLRGTTFNDSIIFFDEFQSATWHEDRTILSRTGTRSKLILSGDFSQNDLIKSKNDQSGFHDLFAVATEMDEFDMIQFTTNDIVRSSFTKNFIIACEKLGL